MPGTKEEFESILVDFNWSHRFNANWTLRNGVVAEMSQDFGEISGGAVADDGRTVDR
ncbi:MAG: hypothetical protein ACREV4_03060 [Gammaproteobacteria bacterium]